MLDGPLDAIDREGSLHGVAGSILRDTDMVTRTTRLFAAMALLGIGGAATFAALLLPGPQATLFVVGAAMVLTGSLVARTLGEP